MKHIFRSFIILSSVVAIIGCRQEELQPIEEENLKEMTFHAGWEPETKTVLQEDGTSIWWSPGDEISIFAGNGSNGGYKFVSTNTETSSTAIFKGNISSDCSIYYALYPYESDAFCNDGTIVAAIPAEQSAKDGSFADGSLLSVAASSNDNLYFRNVCSGIKFSVYNDDITKVVFTSLDSSKPIAGNVSINTAYLSSNSFECYVINDSFQSNSITVYPLDATSFKNGSYYYVALPPQTIKKGLKIAFYKESSVAAITVSGTPPPGEITGDVVFKRGIVKKLLDKDKDLVFTNIADSYANWGGQVSDDTDKSSISNVTFHVCNDTITDELIDDTGDFPLYFSMNGSEANFYTKAASVAICDANSLFEGWSNLKNMNFQGLDFSLANDFSNMFSGCKKLEEIDFSGINSSSVISMAGLFTECRNLKRINFNSFSTGQVRTMAGMFANCMSLTDIDLKNFDTRNVQDMSTMFAGCSSLKTLDLSSFNTSNVENLTGMFGATSYGSSYEKGSNACTSLTELDLSNFNTSKVYCMADMFNGCVNLESINLSGWDTSNNEQFGSMFSNCTSLRELDLSSFVTTQALKAEFMFAWCESLEELDLSNFATPNLTDAQRMFYSCGSLQKLDISNFSSNCLTSASLMFSGCQRLTNLDLGNCDFSNVADCSLFMNAVAYRNDAIAIRCSESTKQLMCQLEDPTFDVNKVLWVNLNEDMPDIAIYQDPELYSSSDFSMHKQVKIYQEAAEGNGIDIVFFGDAYSDRLISDGTYDQDIDAAIEYLFTFEPMKSYRNLFNVYVVYVVSKNESIQGSTAVSIMNATGNSILCEQYIRSAVHDKPMCDIATMVIGHDYNAFAGAPGAVLSSYTYSDEDRIDYGQSQISIAFVGRKDDYLNTAVHEFGHLFAKLEDEYSNSTLTIPDDQVEFLNELYTHLGVGRNIDFTENQDSVKWSKFITDPRYCNTVGVYEGGATYWTGVWRPTDESIMKDMYGEFNAPSREAIYNRIHKLAYGDSWEYDYETFVQQDLKNIPVTTKSSVEYVPYPARVNRKHIFNVEESVSADGKKTVTVITD